MRDEMIKRRLQMQRESMFQKSSQAAMYSSPKMPMPLILSWAQKTCRRHADWQELASHLSWALPADEAIRYRIWYIALIYRRLVDQIVAHMIERNTQWIHFVDIWPFSPLDDSLIKLRTPWTRRWRWLSRFNARSRRISFSASSQSARSITHHCARSRYPPRTWLLR